MTTIVKTEAGFQINSNVPIWVLISNKVNWFYYFEYFNGTVDIGCEDVPIVLESKIDVEQYIKENNLKEMEEQNGELSID